MTDSNFGERLRLRRVARGWSLETLATEMGGVVSRQMLHKYEQSVAKPSPRVLMQLAKTLEISASQMREPLVARVEFVGYRKAVGLSQEQRERIEASVQITAQERLRLQKLLGQKVELPLLPPIESLEDAEKAADDVRKQWDLGVDAICSLSTVLEDHSIHIIEVEAPPKFDGLSARVLNEVDQLVAATVITRRGTAGDRWRFTTAHELGHLVLPFAPDASGAFQEKAAHRFASAFLAPRPLIERELGTKRHFVSPAELFSLKPRLGMSAQALIYRLQDLKILPVKQAGMLFELFKKEGWKEVEPHPLEAEEPQWFKRSVYHALGEGLLSRDYAQRLLGKDWDERNAPPLSAQSQRIAALKKMSIEERREILAEQSKRFNHDWENDAEWKAWEAIPWPDEDPYGRPGHPKEKK